MLGFGLQSLPGAPGLNSKEEFNSRPMTRVSLCGRMGEEQPRTMSLGVSPSHSVLLKAAGLGPSAACRVGGNVGNLIHSFWELLA